jgi:cation-transporting ATPase 13A3/4/5
MIDEQLMGDPLDLKMFGATGLSVLGSRIIGKDLTMNIVKRFDFLSELQRMSVIAQVDGKLALYVKGSPEMVSKLCVKVPDSFDYVLKMYALQGLRIIACAYREVDNIESSRAELENDLIFQGFLIFENQLKPESN